MQINKHSRGVDSTTQDLSTKMQKFKKTYQDAKKKGFDKSKVTIGILKTFHAHDIKPNTVGRNNDKSKILYKNLLCKYMDSNKQKLMKYFAI